MSKKRGGKTFLCFAILFSSLLALAGCSTARHPVPKVLSYAAQDTEDTYLGKEILPITEARPGQSAFILVTDGVDALGARLLLAHRAERSIDLQYYLLHNDITGRLLINELLQAADRGVRVRMLLDDVTTSGYDEGMAALESHPNVEIRIFNPFSRRTGRFLDFITDLGRANHRMHNKSFTVDNISTIVGGRNIGAQYFEAKGDVNYGDLDLIGFGPVAKQVSENFDSYWNSDAAVPVMALVDEVSRKELKEGRARLLNVEEEAAQTPYGKALHRSILDFVEDKEELFWGTPMVTVDPIEKIDDDFKQSHPKRLANKLRPIVLAAQKELFVVTPYFVPREAGVEAFGSLTKRGVKVTVITNSLASNDVLPAHAGYSSYRKDLLELGVDIWEMRRDKDIDRRSRRKRKLGHSQSSLHAKSFIVDNRYVFIGSFNWDPRSAEINTEMGVLLDSPALAEETKNAFMKKLHLHAYQVRLDAEGDIEWVSRDLQGDKDHEQVFSTEPDTSFWRRFKIRFYKLLPIEDHL